MTPLHNPSSGEASSPSAATSPSSTRGCASALDPSNETSASMPGPASHDSPARSSTDFWSAAGSILALQDRTPPLQRKQFRGPPPLSLAQERLWSLEQSEPGLPYYHVPVTWHIRGDLELGALRKSLDFLFQRHEALRTSFPATLNGPVQQISEGHFELPLEVLPCKEAAEPDENAFARAREFARQPFDLEQGPLIRAVLYRLGPQVHWLVLVVHQMIFDGASMRAFSRDLRECYQAFVEQREPVLEELPVRYSDFALWQRECLRDDVLAEDDKFWSEQLRKSYEPLRFPIDHPRKNQGVIPGRQVAFNLPKREMDGLKKLGFDRGVTPFAAFLGCFQAFLARWTKQPDVLTLVSIAARNQRETRNLVGLIANVLPMRMDFSGNLTLEAVIERAGRVVSSSLAHQNLPLSRILEKLPSSRAAVSVPALQVLVIYNNTPLPSLRFPKVTFTPSLALDNGVTKFDLVLDIADSPQGVSGELKYRADLFEESTIVEFLAEWRAFVEAALIEPSATLNLDLSAEENPVPEGCSGTRCASAEAGAASTRNSRREGSAYVAPRSELEQKLASVWESVFDVHPIGIHDNFFGLGGHSLTAVKLINAIERETGQTLRLCRIFEEPTVERLAAAMDSGGGRGSSSIVEIQPGGSRIPVFLVHGVGGGMFWGYNNLSHQLGTDQPVYGFKSRGMEGLEEFPSIEAMAAHYVADLRKFRPTGPYRLGGYCFGGNVAFEMARQLKAAGQAVDLVFLINCWPNNSSYSRLSLTPSALAKAAWNFCFRLGHQFEWAVRQPADFFKARSRWFVKRLRSIFNGSLTDRLAVEDVVDLSSRPEHEQKLWRTHVEAWLRYHPRTYEGRILLLRTRGHPLICSFDHEMGWGAYALGGVTVKTCPGDHESILESNNVGHVARELAGVIDEMDGALGRRGSSRNPGEVEVYKIGPAAGNRAPQKTLSSVPVVATGCLPSRG